MIYNINQAIEILEQTPKILQQFLSNLSDDWIFCNEGEETWSTFDIVGHLIHGEKTEMQQPDKMPSRAVKIIYTIIQ